MQTTLPQRLVIVMCGLVLLAGCSNLEYYGQSVRGQMKLVFGARSIDSLVADPSIDSALRERLVRVGDMRRFAVTELGLPDNDSYRRYVDLKRDYVVWNVFAAPEFSIQPMTWCFPVVGCVAYRGYFARADAERYAGKLREQGLDVATGGVAAYSTLGWFDDPLPNTVINRPEAELAGLVFHELAHQVVYIGDDTAFNESFATAVELEGTRRWFAIRGDPAAAAAFEQDKAREQQVVDLILAARVRLERLYGSGMDVQAKRSGKQRVFGELRRDYRRLRAGWQGSARYDSWFDQPLNNAHLVPVGAYHQFVPAFRMLLQQANGEFTRFYRRVKELAKLPMQERHDRLRALAAG